MKHKIIFHFGWCLKDIADPEKVTPSRYTGSSIYSRNLFDESFDADLTKVEVTLDSTVLINSSEFCLDFDKSTRDLILSTSLFNKICVLSRIKLLESVDLDKVHLYFADPGFDSNPIWKPELKMIDESEMAVVDVEYEFGNHRLCISEKVITEATLDTIHFAFLDRPLIEGRKYYINFHNYEESSSEFVGVGVFEENCTAMRNGVSKPNDTRWENSQLVAKQKSTFSVMRAHGITLSMTGLIYSSLQNSDGFFKSDDTICITSQNSNFEFKNMRTLGVIGSSRKIVSENHRHYRVGVFLTLKDDVAFRFLN